MPAALASLAMSCSVETTVVLLGRRAGPGHRDRRLRRAPGLDERLGDLTDRLARREQHERLVVGVPRPVDLRVRAGHHRDLAVVLRGERDAGVRRDRGRRRDAGHDLERDAGLRAGLHLLGTGGETNGSPAISRTTRRPRLGVPDHDLGAGRVGQRLAVGAEAAVDDLCSSPRARRAATSSVWSGTSVITTSAARTSSAARTVSRSGSPGPLPTNATCPAGRAGCRRSSHGWRWLVHGLAHVCLLPSLAVSGRGLTRRSAGPVRSRDSCPRGARPRRPPPSRRRAAAEAGGPSGRRWRTGVPTSARPARAPPPAPKLLAVVALDQLRQRADRARCTRPRGRPARAARR